MSAANELLTIEQTGELIADLLNESVDDVVDTQDLKALDGWDSMGFLMIMAEMDERFDIVVKEDDLNAISSFKELTSMLHDKGVVTF